MLLLFIAIFLLFLCLIIFNRHKFDNCFRLFTVEIYILLFILIKLPEGTDTLLRFLYSTQIITLNADYQPILEALPTKGAYSIFIKSLIFLAPILTLGFIVTFFKSFVAKITFVYYRLFYDVYVFTELNKKSIHLANDIKKTKKNSRIVFINVEEDNLLWQQVSNNNFLILEYGINDLIFKPLKSINLFLISEDEDSNLITGLKLINSYVKRFRKDINKKKKYNDYILTHIHLFIFNDKNDAEIILNNTEKYGIEVSLFKYANQIAYQLAYEHPFYEIEKYTEKSFLFVGMGKVGFEVFKTLLWCYAENNKQDIKIAIVDKNIDFIRSSIEKNMPAIDLSKYQIEFYKSDLNVSPITKELKKLYNYIVISLGNDTLNINTAINLRAYFLSKDENFSYKPKIVVNIKNKEKASIVKDLKTINADSFGKSFVNTPDSSVNKDSDALNYSLIPFGDFETIYSYNFIINNPLNKIARNVNSFYIERDYVPEYVKNYHFISETDRRQSVAFAIHIKYKMHKLGCELDFSSKLSDSQIDELKSLINKNIEDLMILEQNRFQMFYKCEGWQPATYEESLKYKNIVGSHKFPMIKKHPCICTWSELGELDKKGNYKFQENGRKLVRAIPEFIRYD